MGRELANADVNKAFWKNLLDVNSRSHKCHGCDRHIPATDAKQFETYVGAFRFSSQMQADEQVNSQIARLSSKGLKEIEEEQSMWQEELTKLRKIQPSATIVQELKDDGIPTLEKQVKDETTKLERAQEEVEEVS
jgi:hypothetical protein